MSRVNPKDYDVDELRRIGGEEEREGRREPGEVYLESVPRTPKHLSLSLYWAKFLLSRLDREGAARALEMYRELDWISEAVRREIDATVEVLARGDIEEETVEGSVLCGPVANRFDEHLVSLIYVAKLAGDDIKKILNSRLSLESRPDVKIIEGFDATDFKEDEE